MPNVENIKHYRGDTFDGNIRIHGYTPAESDEIVFEIRQTPDSPEYLVHKEINPGQMKLHLTSEETQGLPERAYYDAQITFEDEYGVSNTKTFVCGLFECTKDVTK